MDELARLEDQLQRAFEGGAWHGPAVLEVLAGVTPAEAAEVIVPHGQERSGGDGSIGEPARSR